MNEKTRTITKKIAKFVVGMSVSSVTYQALRNNTQADNPINATMNVIGAVVVGSIASEVAETYVDAKIEKAFNLVDELKNSQQS